MDYATTSDVDDPVGRLNALADCLGEYGHEPATVNETHGFIDFKETNVNFRSIGDILLAHGFVMGGWDPDTPRLYVRPIHATVGAHGSVTVSTAEDPDHQWRHEHPDPEVCLDGDRVVTDVATGVDHSKSAGDSA